MNDDGSGRLRRRSHHAHALKEGAHGGTRGSPVPDSEAPAELVETLRAEGFDDAHFISLA